MGNCQVQEGISMWVGAAAPLAGSCSEDHCWDCRVQEGQQHASPVGWRLHLLAGSSIYCAGGW